ncbi:MAG: hypothetical protein HC769_02390 [Cyanobacteria bacterium CRU_2_1]|nr:hypothetical protein [Cyanobacteria bacterium RU_5_0]NJR57800.1 hypothetical protein [Cyanobacteria bacterium CRU_2_1]
MMTWNYRVFLEVDGSYVIREVFYAEDGSILGCTENAIEPYGQSLEELAKDIEWFKEALTFPILKLSDIPTPTKIRSDRSHNNTISHQQLMVELCLEHPSKSS